jgi:hypothetical protein
MQKSGNAVFFCGSISLLPDYRLLLSEVCSALPFSRRAVVDASNRSVACSGCGCDRRGGCRRRRYDDALPLNAYIVVVLFG